MIGGLCFRAGIFSPSGEKKNLFKNHIQFSVIFSFREKQCKNVKFSEMNNGLFLVSSERPLFAGRELARLHPFGKKRLLKLELNAIFENARQPNTERGNSHNRSDSFNENRRTPIRQNEKKNSKVNTMRKNLLKTKWAENLLYIFVLQSPRY